MSREINCPTCSFPVSLVGRVGAKLHCPRCDNWMDLKDDGSCSTSCHSCSAHKEGSGDASKDSHGCNTVATLANSQEGQKVVISLENGVGKKRGGAKKSILTRLTALWAPFCGGEKRKNG